MEMCHYNLNRCSVTAEVASRIVLSILDRDRVFRTPYGVFGETCSDRIYGLERRKESGLFWLVLNEPLLKSERFFSETFGSFGKEFFEPVNHWFEEGTEEIWRNDGFSGEPPDYAELCAELGVEPLDINKEVDDLLAMLPTPPWELMPWAEIKTGFYPENKREKCSYCIHLPREEDRIKAAKTAIANAWLFYIEQTARYMVYEYTR